LDTTKQKHRKRNTKTASQKRVLITTPIPDTKKFRRKLFSRTEALEGVPFHPSLEAASVLFAGCYAQGFMSTCCDPEGTMGCRPRCWAVGSLPLILVTRASGFQRGLELWPPELAAGEGVQQPRMEGKTEGNRENHVWFVNCSEKQTRMQQVQIPRGKAAKEKHGLVFQGEAVLHNHWPSPELPPPCCTPQQSCGTVPVRSLPCVPDGKESGGLWCQPHRSSSKALRAQRGKKRENIFLWMTQIVF